MSRLHCFELGQFYSIQSDLLNPFFPQLYIIRQGEEDETAVGRGCPKASYGQVSGENRKFTAQLL